MEIIAEEWRRIECSGDYSVSNTGRVSNNATSKILKNSVHSHGYLFVTLPIKANVYKKHYVHRLVGRYFTDGCRDGLTINHKNGNKKDNRSDNLEWVTYTENNRHARETGLSHIRRGFAGTRRKLTDKQADQIRELRKRGITCQFLSRWFGVTDTVIQLIGAGRSYRVRTA